MENYSYLIPRDLNVLTLHVSRVAEVGAVLPLAPLPTLKRLLQRRSYTTLHCTCSEGDDLWPSSEL